MVGRGKVVEAGTKWTGGAIRRGADGTPKFHLTKRSNGALPCNAVGHDEATAHAALNEYQKDPLGWLAGLRQEAEASSEPVYLSKDLVAVYERARTEPTDNRIPNSSKWLGLAPDAWRRCPPEPARLRSHFPTRSSKCD